MTSKFFLFWCEWFWKFNIELDDQVSFFFRIWRQRHAFSWNHFCVAGSVTTETTFIRSSFNSSNYQFIVSLYFVYPPHDVVNWDMQNSVIQSVDFNCRTNKCFSQWNFSDMNEICTLTSESRVSFIFYDENDVRWNKDAQCFNGWK